MKTKLTGDQLALYSIGVAFTLYGFDKILDLISPKYPTLVTTAKWIMGIGILVFGVLILYSIKPQKKSSK